MNISEKISALRKEKGISQDDFAEMVGVSRQSISKWETGAAVPDTDKIIKMSDIFGVSADYLLRDNISDEEKKADIQIPEKDTEKKEKKKKFTPFKITALVLAAVILVSAVMIPVSFGSYKEAWWRINGGKIKYPYVLVHGLGGWGEDDGINSAAQYWGSTTGNLVEYLKNEGYEVYAPSVGPVSSTWDRACELYAALTGTRVDYGEAHSKAHNHERYGREYTSPLFEGWGEKKNGGQIQKINLVGHSFGGATVRLLTSLLAYGDENEKNATGNETSLLFTGGKADWVNSVTTLCAPHNGSSLTCVLDSFGSVAGIKNTTELLASVCFAVAGVGAGAKGIYDFKLDQFGIGKIEGGLGDVSNAISALVQSGDDHAGYDLSPDGAAEINKKIKTVDSVYYFSFAYCTTKKGKILTSQMPLSSTLPVLYPTALAMGSYKGTTKGGITIDESWQPNDGLVSVVSAQCPTGEERENFDETTKKFERGIWYVAPTREGDHGTVIGLNSDSVKTHEFYSSHFSMIDSLKR